MLINQKFASLLARGGVYLEAADGNGNDLGGGSDADKAAAQKAEVDRLAKEKADKEAADAEAERKAKEATAGGDRRPSDEEAKLLKEVMKKKEEAQALKAEAEKLKADLKAFEGIDPVAIRKLLDEQKEAETKALEAKGEWERLKTRMAEEHTSEKSKLEQQIKDLQDQLNGRDGRINEMTVGGSFNGSEFINKELTLTPSKARVIYGGHFELNDEGQVVGYDKPKGAANRTALVDSSGNPVAFDVALRKIVEADPDKDHLLKSGVRSGAQSQNRQTPGGQNKNEPETKTGMDKIAAGLGQLLAKKD